MMPYKRARRGTDDQVQLTGANFDPMENAS
jgi:hypothetical protein